LTFSFTTGSGSYLPVKFTSYLFLKSAKMGSETETAVNQKEDVAQDQETHHPSNLVEVLQALEPSAKPWILTPHLFKLNFLLLAGLLSQATAGFDGSMVNGLQSLPQWDKYFDHPAKSRLSAIANGNLFYGFKFLISNFLTRN
jgi:hypothetical protein